MPKYAGVLLLIRIFFVSLNKKCINANHQLQDSSVLRKAAANYQTYCASCHGKKINSFLNKNRTHGKDRESIFNAIKWGYANEGMPSFDATFSNQEIYQLADYIITEFKKEHSNTQNIGTIFKTKSLTIRLDTVVKGLDVPWGMAFLPGSEMLITDRNGKIYYVRKDNSVVLVEDGPDVVVKGQGGLLDITPDPEYAKNKLIYLSYSKRKKNLATTAIMRAKFENGRLTQQKDIFIAQPYAANSIHFGSRLQFGKDGYLYFSVGERGNEKENPQQIKNNDLGKIHRIKPDGTVPEDNPFAKMPGASTSIYSYGHRNPQGLTIHPQSGQIWANEHGPKGGDEINIIEAGKNYGWPVITYGVNYNGQPMSPDTKTARKGMEQPLHQWTPSIAPSGMAFVTGEKYKPWEGNILSGSLKFEYLNRSVLKGNKVIEDEALFKNIGRVRNICMAPDGYLYMAVESPGIIYRLVPVSDSVSN